MAKELIIRNGLKILGTLGSGVGDSVLTKDSTTKEVGEVPAIDLSSYISNALPSGNLFIGNISGIATAVGVTGSVLISNTGVTSIASNVIVNSNISSVAAIAYSKLNLANSITNGDIVTGANITRSKLASGSANRLVINNSSGVISEASAITADRVLLSNADGIPTHSAVSTTTLSYLDATSSIQTQLNDRLAFSSAITPVEGDLIIYSSGVWTQLGIGTAAQVLTVDGGLPSWQNGVANGIPAGGATNEFLKKTSATDYIVAWDTLATDDITDITATAAELNLLDGVTTTTAQLNFLNTTTSDVQSQLNNKLANTLSPGYIFVGNGSSLPTQLAIGTAGQVLTVVGGTPQWQTVVGTGTVTSIDVSGGTTGLSFTGGPITTTGTITASGTLVIANGGTGLTALGTALQYLRVNAGATALEYATLGTIIGGSTGSTDNALLRADGTGGVTLQTSPLVVSDTGDVDLGINAVTTGSARTFEAKGSGANISINFYAKGSGGFLLSGSTVAFEGTAAVSSLAPYTEIVSSNAALGGELRFNEGTSNGANYVAFKAPDAITSTVTYTLPEAPSVSGYVLSSTTGGVMSWIAAGGGSGDVVGPASATDNAIARFDTTTGKLIQNGVSTMDDDGNITIGNTSSTTMSLRASTSSDASGNIFGITGPSSTSANNDGGAFNIVGGAANGDGDGGVLRLIGGAVAGLGLKGIITLEANISLFDNRAASAFNSAEGVMFIQNNVTEPTSAMSDGIVLYSRDSSDGSANSTLALYTEQAPEATATFAQTHRLKIWINGVEYWISLDAV